MPVSGCEARESITVAGLRALDGDVIIGHLDDADTFVFTTAINPRHEEPVAARESGKLVLRRAAALEDRLVAGHLRQTSTTSLQACGLDLAFANGVLVVRPDQSASGDSHAA